MADTEIVDLAFRVTGGPIPADHGYAVYSAIARRVPTLHENRRVGVHPIGGRPAGARRLALTPASRLTLRLPAALITEAVALIGVDLDLDGSALSLGAPTIAPLVLRPALWSRLVTISGFMEPEPFLDAVRRQLGEIGVQGEPALLDRQHEGPIDGGAGSRDPRLRRTLRIRGRDIVGYAVHVGQLTADESLHLQEHGLGGRRRFGCGIFVPARG